MNSEKGTVNGEQRQSQVPLINQFESTTKITPSPGRRLESTTIMSLKNASEWRIHRPVQSVSLCMCKRACIINSTVWSACYQCIIAYRTMSATSLSLCEITAVLHTHTDVHTHDVHNTTLDHGPTKSYVYVNIHVRQESRAADVRYMTSYAYIYYTTVQ